MRQLNGLSPQDWQRTVSLRSSARGLWWGTGGFNPIIRSGGPWIYFYKLLRKASHAYERKLFVFKFFSGLNGMSTSSEMDGP